MYQYTDFDRQFVKARANQYRDQLTRWQAGQLPEDEFRPLRLQNGWYVQRYAPMLRVAVPYGELNTAQLRVLAKLLAGSLPGIWLGTVLMKKTPDRVIRSLLSVLLAYAGLKLIAI